MYPIPPSEHLIETKVCKQCNTSFPITDKDMEFYEKVSPIFGGKKYQLPLPTLCPDCRQQRRLSFRNERKLYKRKCDATGNDIVSIYSPDKPFKVYHQDYWWSDKWDPMSYGRDFDFSRGFFEQFGEMMREVPKMSLLNSYHTNSEYCCHTTSMKDSFCVFGSAESQDCLYSNRVEKSNNIVDSSLVSNSSLIYSCFDIKDSYNLYFSQKCSDCSDSRYLFNCKNCKNCFGCINLQGREYYIFNESFKKYDYIKKVERLIQLYTESDFRLRVKSKSIFEASTIRNSENIQGDTVYNSKDIFYGFGIYDSEGLKYSQDLYNHAADSYDCYSGYGPLEKCYECYSFGLNTHHNLFIADCYPITKAIYSDNCYSSFYLFGCIGLRNKSYCILNKQYTKEEYEILVPRIIERIIKSGEWGEFFPSSLSPFGYNETVAQEYFPLSREEVLGTSSFQKGAVDEERGDGGFSDSENRKSPASFHSAPSFKRGLYFNWSDYEASFPTVEKIIPGSKLPDSIESIPDDILNWAIECEVTKKPFRIIKQELEFYRKHNLPIPRRHPDQRHLDRMALRNPRKLYERKCDKCRKDMITTYSPERTEIVYCEECYNREVVG